MPIALIFICTGVLILSVNYVRHLLDDPEQPCEPVTYHKLAEPNSIETARRIVCKSHAMQWNDQDRYIFMGLAVENMAEGDSLEHAILNAEFLLITTNTEDEQEEKI